MLTIGLYMLCFACIEKFISFRIPFLVFDLVELKENVEEAWGKVAFCWSSLMLKLQKKININAFFFLVYRLENKRLVILMQISLLCIFLAPHWWFLDMTLKLTGCQDLPHYLSPAKPQSTFLSVEGFWSQPLRNHCRFTPWLLNSSIPQSPQGFNPLKTGYALDAWGHWSFTNW